MISTTTDIRRHSLRGDWERSINGRLVDYVSVPGSYRPVGECLLQYSFPAPWASIGTDRLFLVTEGVAADAEFSCNGQTLGAAGPWVTYRFEIPAGLLGADNRITARVRDIVEQSFGTMPGRRFDGGLFREIYLERRPAAFIEEVAFHAELDASCSSARCTVQVEINGATQAPVSVTLVERDSGRVLMQTTAPAGEALAFSVDWPQLWSPEMPNLYTLTVCLEGENPDSVQECVGFRRLETRGQDFYLNNQRLVLRGVCRHEFTGEHGYSPTPEEVRYDLAMIKHAGFNYVRLVHSPQAPLVPRLAAEIGLLVSEEPGACWLNFEDKRVAAPALETLRRTVLRDRNVPSILAWLIYNECEPNIAYATRAASICRELAPGSLVSFADSSGNDALVQTMLHEAGLSFYGVNQYSMLADDYVARMSTFTDRPLVFTEWGGWWQQGNARQFRETCAMFAEHTRVDATPRVAGCSFWVWADYEEYSRSAPSAIAGWTIEGVLDQQAQPREDLQILSQMCFAMQYAAPRFAPPVEILARAPAQAGWLPLSLRDIAGEQATLEERVAETRAAFTYCNPSLGQALIAGIPFSCRDDHGIAPLLLGEGRAEIVIPINRLVAGIAVLGHVAPIGGYPANATYSVYHRNGEVARALGQPASHYVLVGATGVEEEEIALLHGVHMLRSNNICRWWKVNPLAPDTTPALQTALHPSYEILRFDLWQYHFTAPRFLREIRWRLDDPQSVQAMLACSVLVAE